MRWLAHAWLQAVLLPHSHAAIALVQWFSDVAVAALEMRDAMPEAGDIVLGSIEREEMQNHMTDVFTTVRIMAKKLPDDWHASWLIRSLTRMIQFDPQQRASAQQLLESFKQAAPVGAA